MVMVGFSDEVSVVLQPIFMLITKLYKIVRIITLGSIVTAIVRDVRQCERADAVVR